MDVVATTHEHLGPVVPVDEPSSQHQVTLKVPRRPSNSSAASPVLGGSEHKLIGSTDEHHILTTPGGQRAAQLAALAPKPKFNALINEYVGACFEDNCNIGKISFSASFFSLGILHQNTIKERQGERIILAKCGCESTK